MNSSTKPSRLKPFVVSRGGEVRLPPYQKVSGPFQSLGQRLPYGLEKLNVPLLHQQGITGEGVKVAILDTGIAPHDDLKGRVDEKLSRSFVNSVPSNYVDGNGHGTHCAGIVAAVNNDFGVLGVAPDATLVILQVLDADGSGSFKGVADAIDYAVDSQVDIISMSLGASAPNSVVEQAVKRAVKKGVFLFSAAGNDGNEDPADDIDWPGRYAGKYDCYCIAAVDENFNIAWFSSDGEENTVAAPGVKVTSTYLDNQYIDLSGTSMATPYASGVAALIVHKAKKLGLRSNLTPPVMKRVLMASAIDKGPVGHDPRYGAGIVNPVSAVEDLESWMKPRILTYPVIKRKSLTKKIRLALAYGFAIGMTGLMAYGVSLQAQLAENVLQLSDVVYGVKNVDDLNGVINKFMQEDEKDNQGK